MYYPASDCCKAPTTLYRSGTRGFYGCTRCNKVSNAGAPVPPIKKLSN